MKNAHTKYKIQASFMSQKIIVSASQTHKYFLIYSLNESQYLQLKIVLTCLVGLCILDIIFLKLLAISAYSEFY